MRSSCFSAANDQGTKSTVIVGASGYKDKGKAIAVEEQVVANRSGYGDFCFWRRGVSDNMGLKMLQFERRGVPVTEIDSFK